ncbi:MAG: glycolate oxidase subunit GlcE [Pseudomonadales bacterium]|nr:glycolate oxidase subunit GlcE [Pseudomonadales bacterium]MCP5202971.1 glycolate oxidase subunit GlcE [Pseudomonadales bacterium]
MPERPDGDIEQAIATQVRAAAAHRQGLYIQGGGSKRALLGRDCEAAVLDVSGHCGITDYQPAELVLSARAGTPLTALQAVLATQGQELPFEPPTFQGRATLGGTLACNLSGPARPWRGSIRDLVLGVRLVDASGECLRFGGKVMKNVAGYDVSRLQAGALGTLGVLTEISVKVLPRAQRTTTLAYELPAAEAIEMMNRRAATAAPLSGACWLDGTLYLRLAGEAGAVAHTARRWGGQALAEADAPWSDLREMRLPFFAGDAPLWRLSVKPSAALAGPAAQLLDWGGAQRWLRGDFDLAQLQGLASAAGGHVTLFRGGDRRGEVRPFPGEVHRRLQQRLKHSFDPQGLFNPGRLYGWL